MTDITATEDNNALVMWTVYDHPTDFPNNYVARKFMVTKGRAIATEEIILCPDLEALREQLEQLGLVPLKRDPHDDAKIVETWL